MPGPSTPTLTSTRRSTSTARKPRRATRDVIVHLVEEYARHVGHVDLLRECIDGRTGHRQSSTDPEAQGHVRDRLSSRNRPGRASLFSGGSPSGDGQRSPYVHERPPNSAQMSPVIVGLLGRPELLRVSQTSRR